MTDLRTLIEALVDHQVEFVIIGGVALVLQGSARTTRDLDLCYPFIPDRTEKTPQISQMTQMGEAFGPQALRTQYLIVDDLSEAASIAEIRVESLETQASAAICEICG